MSRRFSRILGSSRLRPAADRYIQYLSGTLTRPSRVGQGGPRQATQSVYYYPFGLDLPTDQVLTAKVDPAHYNILAPVINGVTGVEITNGLGAKTLSPLRGISPARVVWFRNATRSVQVATSTITGLEYLKYNGDRYACPFGRDGATSTADMYDAFSEIKGDLLSTPGFVISRVSIQRERLSY